MTSTAPVAGDDLSLRERKKLQTRKALHDAARTLVLEHGAAATIEEICREAGVSGRTFFNYYPSKAAAALGLPDLRIGEEEVATFLAGGTGPVVPDLCRLLGGAIDAAGGGRPDKAAVRELLHRWPDLRPEVFQWMDEARRGFVELAERRVAPARARAAVSLVFAGLMELMARDAGAGRTVTLLMASVDEMIAAATESTASE